MRARLATLAAAALLACAAPALADTPTRTPDAGQLDGAYSIALGLSLRPVHGTLEIAAAMGPPRSLDQLMTAAAAGGATADDLVRGEVVALAEMEEMRAGFDMPGGLTVRFGFDISHSLNGQVVQRLVMPTSTITPHAHNLPVTLTDSQGTRTLTNATLPQDLQSLANGGATRLATSLGANGVVTLLQNTASNQLIQRSAALNFDISGMRSMLDRGAMQTLVSSAMSARRMLPR